jgi:small subunit ribosomal protein S9
MVQYLGTGRRKRSVARVFLRPGQGNIQINGKPLDSYFPTESLRVPVKQPLLATETADKFDVLILANGGGVSVPSRRGSLGIARALVEFNVELRQRLKKLGFSRVIRASTSARSTARRARASASSSPNASHAYGVLWLFSC